MYMQGDVIAQKCSHKQVGLTQTSAID